MILQLEHITISFGSRVLFSDVTFRLEEHDRLALVGPNGAGKTTMLNIITGKEDADDGRIILAKGAKLGYLEQEAIEMGERPIFEEVLSAQHEILNQERHMRELETSLGENPTEQQLASYGRARDQYEAMGGYQLESRVRSVLFGLGFGEDDMERMTSDFSGGWQMRIALAKLLTRNPEVLLLDEPTNHLDVVAINWLAKHLKKRFSRGAGALVVVTHDRWFLDEVCLRMWEVHDGIAEPFEGGYSAYILQRVERQRQAEVAEQKRQNLIRRELAFLSRGARARSSKPRFHVETARALIAEEPPLRNTTELKRAAISRLGKKCVDVIDASFSYGQNKVLDDVTWMIGPGDRYGLLGANGAGKSTLLDIVQGKLRPQTGRVKIGKTVKFAFLSQKLEELEKLKGDRVREVLSRYNARYMIDGKEVSPAQLLEQLGFTNAHLNMPVETLSGGQKRRLQLMLILLDSPNVLILDEPSNDLDTDMTVAMENLLDTWPGTLIVVSHDRYLMERVTDDQFALIDGKLMHCPRGVDEYLELLEEDRRAQSNKTTSASKQGSAVQPQAKSGLSVAEVRELKKQARSIENKMKTQEKKLAQAKEDLLKVDPYDYQALGEAQAGIHELEQRIEALEEEWLLVAEQMEG